MSHIAITEKQIKRLKQQLLKEKHDLEKHFDLNEHYGLSASLGDNTGELSTYDNHPADIATELYDRSKDIALNESSEHQLDQVNIALEKIESGEYGYCITCHKPIPFPRLEAIPTTLYCKEHVPDPNRSDRRPIEERLLAPPFGRTSLDELDGQNQFDGEDTWQIVESWGTSNTPAMAEGRDISDYNEMYIEADENDGFVETFESFIATDIYGKNTSIVRNKAYRQYMSSGEGERLLEPEYKDDDKF